MDIFMYKGQRSYISLRFGVKEILSLSCSFVDIQTIKFDCKLKVFV